MQGGKNIEYRASIRAFVICETICITAKHPITSFVSHDNVGPLYDLFAAEIGWCCFGAPTEHHGTNQGCHCDEILKFRPRQKHRLPLLQVLVAQRHHGQDVILTRGARLGLRRSGFGRNAVLFTPLFTPADFSKSKNAGNGCATCFPAKLSANGGKADMAVCECLLSRSLSGVKRTSLVATHMSACDPKRT